MPIGIMDSKRSFIEFQDDLADKEGENMNTRVCAVSFHSPIITFDIVA